MTTQRDGRTELVRVARLLGPRVLTQASRDPSAETFGCFDRNYWHYRIRDFPSAILQQGALGAHALSQIEADHERSRFLTELARGGAEFWNRRAVRHGAFEEYYPYERGYPPLAFSSLAVGLLATDGVVSPHAVDAGVQVAARQLLHRFEPEAANQQVAGLAALAVLRNVFPHHVDDAAFEKITERTFELQTSEGWFPEYGGPDLGYLSVSVDALWDYHDATGDERAIDAIVAATAYSAALIGTDDRSIGMHNSRNTDYLVPYGLLRTAMSNTEASGAAAELFDQLYGEIGPGHFLMATDDRYLAHYLGTSLFRAAVVARTAPLVGSGSPAATPSDVYFPDSGQVIRHFDHGTFRASLSKGGVLSYTGEHPFADFGVSVESDDDVFVSHWWSDHWRYGPTVRGFETRGAFVRAPRIRNSPGRHAALRVAAGVAGARLIGALKDRMIFAKPDPTYTYRRSIEITDAGVLVVDVIRGLMAGDWVIGSPRFSRRHVASANSYHHEDTLVPSFEHQATASEERFVHESFYPFVEVRGEPA